MNDLPDGTALRGLAGLGLGVGLHVGEVREHHHLIVGLGLGLGLGLGEVREYHHQLLAERLGNHAQLQRRAPGRP